MGTFFRGSSSFCFIQHIMSSGFSSVQCCFEFFPTTFQRSIEPLLACSHVHTRKRRPWHCVPNSFFSSCIHAVLLFEIILLVPLAGSVVVILESCPHHEQYCAKCFIAMQEIVLCSAISEQAAPSGHVRFRTFLISSCYVHHFRNIQSCTALK